MVNKYNKAPSSIQLSALVCGFMYVWCVIYYAYEEAITNDATKGRSGEGYCILSAIIALALFSFYVKITLESRK